MCYYTSISDDISAAWRAEMSNVWPIIDPNISRVQPAGKKKKTIHTQTQRLVLVTYPHR